MTDAQLDLLTTRACSPLNTWASVRGFLVVALERERINAQIAVLDEAMERMKAHLGLLRNAELRYAYELLRDRRDALKKELGE